MNQPSLQPKTAASVSVRLPRRAWLRALAAWLGWLLIPATLVAADSVPGLEYKVKAGYLYNFARFVEWPAAAFPSADSPFVIAVMDGGEAFPVLEQILAGKTVNGRPVKVVASQGALPTNAHILLVTRKADKTPEEIRAAVASRFTLTVGETDQFAERGGAVAFVREGESVRLTLCLEHASENGLKVSAKLSNVAKSVKSRSKN